MRTGRPKATLKLNEDEKRELTSLAHRSRSAPVLARRARMVLACAEGHDNQAVARKLRVTPATVGKWRGRFGGGAHAGKHPTGGHALEYSRDGQGQRAQSHDHQPHLAGFRLAAASQREL